MNDTTTLEPVNVPATVQQSGWLAIIDKMIERNTPTDILTKVFELQQKNEAENQRKAFVAAFAAFKAEAPTSIERTGKVSFPGKGGSVAYNHVKLEKACAEIVPIMAKHNLAHSWEVNQADGGLITVTCRIDHADGHSRSVTLRGSPDQSGSKNPIQAVGSAVYYLQRYTFMAACGMAQADEDDDGVGSEPEYISGDQVEEINIILEEKNVELEPFLEWAKVEAISKIETKDFDRIMKEMRRWKKRTS